jgi:hypothetical protein
MPTVFSQPKIPLAHPLAELVAGMSGGAAIERAVANLLATCGVTSSCRSSFTKAGTS